MSHKWSTIICCLAAVSVSGNVSADTTLVRPSLTLNEIYDSNVNYGSRGNEKVDFITGVMPRIEILEDRKGLSLSGSYSLNYRYYSRKPELSYMGHNGNIGLKAELGHMTSLAVSDSIAYSKDSREADGMGVQLLSTGLLTNAVSVSLSHKMTPLTSVVLRGSDSMSWFDNTAFVNSRTDSGGIDLMHEFNRQLSGTSGYTYTNYQFDGEDNAHSHYFQIGLSEKFSPDFSIGLSGGVIYWGEVADRYDWGAQVSLLKKFETSSISVAYSRGTSTSYGLSSELSISDRVSMTWLQTFARALDLSISGGYSQVRSEPTGRLNVKSYDGRIAADWKPATWMTFGTGYSRFQQWAEGSLGTDLAKDQVFVSISTSIDNWRF